MFLYFNVNFSTLIVGGIVAHSTLAKFIFHQHFPSIVQNDLTNKYQDSIIEYIQSI